ncbi:MAG: AAA family ATPase [Actinobacteria bacterium]|nr:AAA family ATPase [Actinomycetota bacterium]
MYVKRLKLAGFKSFAAPTVMEFERGVNVVVGPNGSGKSNISDALSWVLGAQAPSTLRSGSMEDVIFAGSETKSRLGLAEVALTLDNTSGLLPLDLAEVTISRTADRSGGSEYRINGAACRLLDVTELISDTGVGRSIHTVVGQGNLDAVLQSKPEDRRTFIEEAAQIGKFRRRKERALRKLERVDDNVMRLNDVLTELRRGLRPLKRQANAASRYSELMSEQRELRQRLAATEIHRLSFDEAALDVESEERKTQLLADELANVRAVLEGAEGEREAIGAEATEQQQTANRIGRAADRLEGLGRLADERAQRITARLAAETEEGYRERIRLLESDRERWSKETEGLEAQSAAATERAEVLRQDAETARARQNEAERALAEARGAETAAAQDLVRAEGSESASRQTLGSLEARVHAATERREVREREVKSDEHALIAAEKEVTDFEAELDRVTELAAAAEMELENRRERAEGLKEKLNATHAQQAAAEARLEALEEVAGVVADIPTAAARLEPLVQRAREQAAVASAREDEDGGIVKEADEAVEEAWLVVASHDEDLRRLDAHMSAAAERLAGRRRKREAREIELAALNEELARVQEALAQAERAAIEERAALPQRRQAHEEANEMRVIADSALAEARSTAEQAGRRAGDAAMEARSAEERMLSAKLRLEEAEAGIADAQTALEGLTELRASLTAARDRARVVAETASMSADQAAAWASEAETRAGEARAKAHAGDERLSSLRTRERELDTNLADAAQRRNQAEVRRAEMRARMEALGERALDEWGLGVDELKALDRFDEADEEASRVRVEGLERDLRRLGAVNPNAAEEYEEAAKRETFLVDQMNDLETSKRDLMKIVREVDQTIVEAFSSAYDDVAREFETVFARLFPGGTGKLKLTDPDDLLNSGIEVEARPPGKNVRKLSLLSGGERSLVALAFLFAIFRSRPSPFYLLDEVEAALDDVNLARFIGLVHELEANAQVLIVTHQKRTMEAADVLYGVTMREGISSVVAQRMEDVDRLARESAPAASA